MTLAEEEARATTLLAGKTVRVVRRHRSGEVVLEFTDGSRLFADVHAESLELSIELPCE